MHASQSLKHTWKVTSARPVVLTLLQDILVSRRVVRHNTVESVEVVHDAVGELELAAASDRFNNTGVCVQVIVIYGTKVWEGQQTYRAKDRGQRQRCRAGGRQRRSAWEGTE